MNRTTNNLAKSVCSEWLLSLLSTLLKLPSSNIKNDQPLSRYGLDSLASTQIIAAISQKTEIELDDDFLLRYRSVNEITNFFACPITECNTSIQNHENNLAAMRNDSILSENLNVPFGVQRVGENILVTGATGFLGVHLLAEITRDPRSTVFCLVRAETEEFANNRLRNAFDQHGLYGFNEWDRIRIVVGDVRLERLGLDYQQYVKLSSRVDSVIHAAAQIGWNGDYSSLKESNVFATREIIQFCCFQKAKPLTFISSISTCYSSTAPKTISEHQSMIDYLDGIHLGYAQSKCVAENLVQQAYDRGLNCNIVRPTLLIGNSESGHSNLDDFFSRLVKGCIQLGFAPDLDLIIDCYPVDDAARAILSLVQSNHSDHLYSSLVNISQRHWRELVLWINLYGYPVQLVDYAQWVGYLAELSDPNQNEAASLLPFFQHIPHNQNQRSVLELFQQTLRSEIDCSTSHNKLQNLGVLPHRLTAKLLNRYFDSFQNRGFLPHTKRTKTIPNEQTISITSIVEKILSSNPELSNHNIAPIGEITGHGIITELCSWRTQQEIGLFSFDLDYRTQQNTLIEAQTILKAKANEQELQSLVTEIAQLCSPTLGEMFSKYPEQIGLQMSGLRESKIYAFAYSAFKRHTPHFYGYFLHPSTKRHYLLLEHLDAAVLMENSITECWSSKQIGVAIIGLARLHSVFYCQTHLLEKQEWISNYSTYSEMQNALPLWQALLNHAREYYDEWLGIDSAQLLRHILESLSSWTMIWHTSPLTLIHNDFNPRNIAIRDNNLSMELCVFDWELATIGLPQYDLAELLCFVSPEDLGLEQLELFLRMHRLKLQEESGYEICAELWAEGFHVALNRLIIDRFAKYCIIHRFQPKNYLKNVIRNWFRLYQLSCILLKEVENV